MYHCEYSTDEVQTKTSAIKILPNNGHLLQLSIIIFKINYKSNKQPLIIKIMFIIIINTIMWNSYNIFISLIVINYCFKF